LTLQRNNPQKDLMIRLDNVSKQAGHQILFIEASAALNKGEKIGLVGPNGAGKTTLFGGRRAARARDRDGRP
jgi:ATPase subunit of ABC transporter with duplicated ATPase domains